MGILWAHTGATGCIVIIISCQFATTQNYIYLEIRRKFHGCDWVDVLLDFGEEVVPTSDQSALVLVVDQVQLIHLPGFSYLYRRTVHVHTCIHMYKGNEWVCIWVGGEGRGRKHCFMRNYRSNKTLIHTQKYMHTCTCTCTSMSMYMHVHVYVNSIKCPPAWGTPQEPFLPELWGSHPSPPSHSSGGLLPTPVHTHTHRRTKEHQLT